MQKVGVIRRRVQSNCAVNARLMSSIWGCCCQPSDFFPASPNSKFLLSASIFCYIASPAFPARRRRLSGVTERRQHQPAVGLTLVLQAPHRQFQIPVGIQRRHLRPQVMTPDRCGIRYQFKVCSRSLLKLRRRSPPCRRALTTLTTRYGHRQLARCGDPLPVAQAAPDCSAPGLRRYAAWQGRVQTACSLAAAVRHRRKN